MSCATSVKSLTIVPHPHTGRIDNVLITIDGLLPAVKYPVKQSHISAYKDETALCYNI